MITDAEINRINELARKKKTVGLSEAELEEQALLRRKFIDSMKANVKAQLDNIDMVEKDGTIVNLGEKYGNKKSK